MPWLKTREKHPFDDYDDEVNDFLAFKGQLEMYPEDWKRFSLDEGRRVEALKGGGPATKGPSLQEESQQFTWEDVDEGPPDTDDSWAEFGPNEQEYPDGKALKGGKKLTKEQRQKQKDAEQLAEARDSIRRRGWTEGEVKWRSWLARRGHDTMVHDWNLYQYIDGECIPPSRDPFWLNSNEVPLPDYEAGNDVPNEVGPMEVTSILGERIEPKWKPPRVVQLAPLWQDVDADALAVQGLGRVTDQYYWRQTLGMVFVEVKVPEGTSGRELNVTIAPTRLTIAIGNDPPMFDQELYMRIYVGSNVDDESSIWELQDKRVVVFHLVKWHRLEAGNVRDTSRTWWRQCFVSEEPFPHENPHGEYYQQKDK